MWQLFCNKVYLTPQPAHGKGQPGRILILAGETTCMLTVEGLSLKDDYTFLQVCYILFYFYFIDTYK